jgi:outer membrane usher protein
VTFRIEEADLRLALVADPTLLGIVVRDLDGGAPPDMVFRSAPSAFFNYAITTGTELDYEVFAESGISAGGALLYTTTTKNARATIRGLSNFTIDRRSRLQRWIVGDNFATAGPLGGDTILAGITIAREFSLAPYFVRHPTMSVTTPITTPSVLEVHVNGRLLREEQVQPGVLDLRNLPMANGRNDTRLVLRDPFGGTREITSGFYVSTTSLARGVQDYQYSLGWRRERFGSTSWDYSEPVAVARHRIGFTDRLTAGLRIEGQRGMVSGGPLVNLRLPFGELELAGGGSRDAGHNGHAAHVSYNYSGSLLSFGGLLARTSNRYAHVSLRGDEARPSETVGAFASVPTGAGSSVTVQHHRSIGEAAVAESRTSLLGTARIARRADLVANVTRVGGSDDHGFEASLGVTVAFGARNVANVSAVRRSTGTQTNVDLQRPLPLGTGFGYQLRAESGERTSASGAAQYQGNYGRYEVRHDGVGAAARTTFNVSGGLVAIGGGLHASRPLRNSYALVRVPGVDGVRTYSSNQEVGRTSRGGTVLVPDLLPYYGNRLAIADSDVPLDFQVPEVQVTLALPYRGGAVALFAVQRIQRITGRVIVAGAQGERRPAYANLAIVVNGEPMLSPIGADGEFYFENVPPGRYEAVVTETAPVCRVTLDIPRQDSASVSLGAIRCEEGGAQ